MEPKESLELDELGVKGDMSAEVPVMVVENFSLELYPSLQGLCLKVKLVFITR